MLGTRCLAAWFGILLAAAGGGVARSEQDSDERVAAEFETFATQEIERIHGAWRERKGRFFSQLAGTPSEGGKYVFYGLRLEAVPDDYTVAVRRTDSPTTPYVGQIEYSIILVHASVSVKGKKKFCKNKPLRVCLENGGVVMDEQEPADAREASRLTRKLTLQYVYRDDRWEPVAAP